MDDMRRTTGRRATGDHGQTMTEATNDGAVDDAQRRPWPMTHRVPIVNHGLSDSRLQNPGADGRTV
jgi:hypothetical protein